MTLQVNLQSNDGIYDGVLCTKPIIIEIKSVHCTPPLPRDRRGGAHFYLCVTPVTTDMRIPYSLR